MENGINGINCEQTVKTSSTDLYYKVYERLHEEVSAQREAGKYDVCYGLIMALEILQESYYH